MTILCDLSLIYLFQTHMLLVFHQDSDHDFQLKTKSSIKVPQKQSVFSKVMIVQCNEHTKSYCMASDLEYCI